jgi:hypothetical protein
VSRIVDALEAIASERRGPWIAALVALVAALATMTTDPIGVFNDDGIYLLTAKALAEGQGYVYPHLPGTPAAIHYPPVWPMLLAAVWRFAPAFPENIAWFKLINPLILAASAAGATLLGRRMLGLSPLTALVAVVAATISIPVLLLNNLLLSEPLFLALLIPTLWMAERLVREGSIRTAAIAAGLVALLVLVRTLGGTVLVATVLLLARERRWRELGMYVGVAGLLLLPWQLFVWRASVGFPDELRGSYGPYLEWAVGGYRTGGIPFLRDVLAKNVGATWNMLGVFASGIDVGILRQAAAALSALSLLTGLVLLSRRDRTPVTALAVAGYLGVSLAWPFWVDRFLWVLWPLLVLIAVAGLLGARERWRATGHPRAALAAAGVLGALALGHTAYNARGLWKGWESSASREMATAGIRLVQHVNSDRSLDGKIIAAELAPLLAIYTGARVLPVEILTPREHVVEKTAAEHVAELERIDRRFQPDAYVVMHAGPYYAALREAKLDGGRTLVDDSPPRAPIRTLRVERSR